MEPQLKIKKRFIVSILPDIRSIMGPSKLSFEGLFLSGLGHTFCSWKFFNAFYFRISSNISRGFFIKNEILFLYLDLQSSPPIFSFRYSKLPFLFGFVYPGATKRVQIPITGDIIKHQNHRTPLTLKSEPDSQGPSNQLLRVQ